MVQPESHLSNRSVEKLAQRTTATEYIDKKHNHCDDQQGVNQTAAHLHGKTQKP